MGFNTLRFEADPSGGGVEAPPPAPVAPAPAPPASPPPASWAPSREEWEQTQAFQSAVMTALMEDDQPDPAVGPPPQIDLSTPEKVVALIEEKAAEKAQALMSERLGPYMPVLDKQMAEEGKALVHAELTKIAKGDPDRGVEGVGEFDLDMAGKLAQSFHATGIPPEQAILLAARETYAYEARIRQAALTAERGQMQNRLEAGREPAPGGAVHESAPAREGEDRYQRIAREWEEKRKTAGSPVG